LDESAGSANSEISGRIAESLEAWSSASVVRRIVKAGDETVAQLKKICTLKLKVLSSASASLSSVLH
jgi:N-terminal acetyltransferase B complex non-catalytic subunit